MDINSLCPGMNTEVCESVNHAIGLISKNENEVNCYLEGLFMKQCQIESKMSGIGRALLILNTMSCDSRRVNSQIAYTAKLADSVSANVIQLDLARSRAFECQQRVHDLIDLQLCSQGVLSAINDENYEKGAVHIARFLAMDQLLLQRTADDVQGSITSVSKAVKMLEKATHTMREMIDRRFNEAASKDDLASVEQYFKIFPLLGCHHKGIQKFANYICLKLSQKSQKDLRNAMDIAKAEQRMSVAYADTLTSLLENFARVVEVNQPIMDACYGAGFLLDMVAILQRECDLEIKNLILEFNKNRQVPRRIQQLNEIKRAGSGGVGGGGIHGMGHYRRASEGSVDKLNPKEIDTVIAEITVMHSRAELYFRFIRRRVTTDLESSYLENDDKQVKLAKLENIINFSDLSRQMQELLSMYLLFERYFMEESVLKAIALDTYEVSQQCSSMVDDIFFILKKSMRRALKTQSVNGTCAVINNAASCLDGDFINALMGSLKSGYPSGYIDLAHAYNAIQTSLQQGRLQSSDSDKARNNFLVQLNNADMSTEYIRTLWQTMEQDVKATFPSMSQVELQIMENCFAELKAVGSALKACVDFGMQQLLSTAIKPRLNPWVDQFHSYNHVLTNEELSSYEAGETFVQFLIVQTDGLLNVFKAYLSPRNYDALVSVIATEITMRLERAIKKTNFNRLGGLVLDQEVRLLGSYLTSATSWSVRDKMTRLTQIATILNMDKISELSDYWSPDNNIEMASWRITLNEVRAILKLRTDFRIEDIKRVKL